MTSSSSATWRRYGGVAETALRQALAERAAVVGRVAFYAVILLIFSRLWLGVAGAALAYALTGAFPADPRGLALVLPLGLLAAWLGLVSLAAIGLCAFWLQDSSPVFWIWQKAAFVLGGLLLPLEIYPDWLRAIALASPFSALMHGPGRMAFGWDPLFAAGVALRLIAWGAVTTALLVFVYRRALRVLDVNGG